MVGSKRGRTIGSQQKMSCILAFAPLDLVDLLFDF